MIAGKSVAIAIVDTQQYTLAANALFNSIGNLAFDQILIYSDKEAYWGGNEVIKINKITKIEEYNEIILKKLPENLNCDFVLIIQYDGFVLNPSIFDPTFFDYDYIGAPWNHLSTNNIGNGGFSLRSKKLVAQVGKLNNIDFSIPEDVLICQKLRPLKDFELIKFPPIEIAKIFSFEFPIPNFKTFGFHGIFNLPIVYRDKLDYLIDNLSDECLISKYEYLKPFVYAISSTHGDLLLHKYNNLKGY